MTTSPKPYESPADAAWDHATAQFARWIGPVEDATVRTARQHFLSYCRSRSEQAGLDEAAPLIAFGFLTKAAFDNARRKTRIFG